MSMFFIVEGFGNYSENFGWDNGLSTLSEPKHVTKAEISELYPERACSDFWYPVNTDKQTCRKVQQYFINEHGGSRNVRFLVKAMGYQQAAELAREFADAMYPCKGS